MCVRLRWLHVPKFEHYVSKSYTDEQRDFRRISFFDAQIQIVHCRNVPSKMWSLYARLPVRYFTFQCTMFQIFAMNNRMCIVHRAFVFCSKRQQPMNAAAAAACCIGVVLFHSFRPFCLFYVDCMRANTYKLHLIKHLNNMENEKSVTMNINFGVWERPWFMRLLQWQWWNSIKFEIYIFHLMYKLYVRAMRLCNWPIDDVWV